MEGYIKEQDNRKCKEVEETSRSNEHTHYLDYSNGFMEHRYAKAYRLHILNMSSLLLINYTSRKLFFRKRQIGMKCTKS